MNKKLANQHIDFADSEYISFHMSEDATLTLHLKSWDAKKLRVVFKHTIYFLYSLGSDPANLFEVESTPEFERIIIEAYGTIDSDHPFKSYILEDIDDFPFIKVIAEAVTVVKE